MPFFPRKISEPSGLPAFFSQWFCPRIRPVLAPMSFYAAPTFPPVPTVVGYNATLATSVALTQPMVPPLALPAMATLDGKTVDVIAAPAFQPTDPVTKAVMDNIMGKLPTKKPAVISKCEICNLEFSGQVVLDTHLAGAKHAKKVKSLEILKQLQTTGQNFSRDETSKVLKCEICEVVVNSSQQLQTHLSGNKHKQKAGKLLGKEFTPNTPKSGAATNGNTGTNSTTHNEGEEKVSTSQPDCSGQKTTMPGAPKVTSYVCETCNMTLNSEIQLEQHLTSRKHKDKLSGKVKQRPAPYWKRFRGGGRGGSNPRGSFFPRGKKSKQPLSAQYSQPLSSNFVSGSML